MTKKTPAPVQFTADEKKLLQGYAYAVWDECAYDVLQAVAEDKRKDVNSVSVSRAVAIEIALDAGRMEDQLRSAAKHGNPLVTADLLARVDAADYKTLIAAVRPAFGFARYGM